MAAIGGLQARLVAVETQDRLLRHAPQKRALFRRERRAERGDDVGEAGRRHRDHIDIALDGDHRPGLMRRLAGVVQIVERRALVKQRRFRRIQILSNRAFVRTPVFRRAMRVLLQRPPAEGDHRAAAIMDRKHQPMAEAVIGDGDVLAVDEQPRLDHRLHADALGGERVAQAVAVRRGVADAKMRLSRRRNLPPGEIVARIPALRALELPLKIFGRPIHDLRQGSALLIALALLARPTGMGSPAMPASRSTASGKEIPSVSIRKAKPSPCLPDEKSWKNPFWSLTKKEGLFSALNGRQPNPLTPLLSQLDFFPNHLRHGNPRPNFVEKGGRKFHGGPC